MGFKIKIKVPKIRVKAPKISAPKISVPKIRVRLPGAKNPINLGNVKAPRLGKIRLGKIKGPNLGKIKLGKIKAPKIRLPGAKNPINLKKIKAPKVKVRGKVLNLKKIKAPKIKVRGKVLKAPKIRVKAPNFKPILKVAGTVTKSADAFVKKAQKKIKKVPVAGTLVSSLYDWTYGHKVELVRQIAKGKRIDKAAYAALKVKVKAGQELAPYAQTIVSTVPGVGPGVSGALGAALALSKGRRIDEALYEGVKDSIPGGPAARAAFEVAYALASGKDVGRAALEAIPVGPTEKRLIVEGVGAVTDLAKGKKLNEVLVDRGIAALPNAKARKAAQIGIALAEGKRLQDIAYEAMPLVMPKLRKEGKAIAEANPLFKAGYEALKKAPQAKKGYELGLGFLAHKETEVSLDAAFRLIKNVKEKEGFELAAAITIGANKVGKKPNKSNKKSFGKAVRAGVGKKGKTMKGDKLVKQVEMLDPEIAAGVKEQEDETWWDRFVDLLGDLF